MLPDLKLKLILELELVLEPFLAVQQQHLPQEHGSLEHPKCLRFVPM